MRRRLNGKTPTTIDQSERRKESRDGKTDDFRRKKKEGLEGQLQKKEREVTPTVGSQLRSAAAKRSQLGEKPTAVGEERKTQESA